MMFLVFLLHQISDIPSLRLYQIEQDSLNYFTSIFTI